MSTVEDFNRIEDCDKIDALCVDAYVEAKISDENPTTLEVNTSWGDSEIDLAQIVKDGETLTTMYLSPEDNPNCLVYEPERGDNICIAGDDLSRIISMTKLKDTDQSTSIADGDVYMWDGVAGKFKPYDLKTALSNSGDLITALQDRVTALEQIVAGQETRTQTLEALLTPPTGAPTGAKVVWGNINTYSDSSAAINSSGAVTSLDKTHGLYTHDLSNTVYGDQIFG